MSEHKLHPFVPEDAEKVVLQIILARRMRTELFALDLFSDPAWDLLLVLFLARLREQRMAVSQLAAEASVSVTAVGRWLDALDRHGLLNQGSAPGDARRTFVELSAHGTSAMQRWVQGWIESQSGSHGDDRVIDLLTRMRGDRG